MDIRQLQVFCSIVDKKSFSRAARSVGLSQPTVSAHIKSLETELGTKLLDRLGKEVLPTKTGQVLYRYARRVLKCLTDAKGEIALLDGASHGELSLGSCHLPGTYLLPDAISDYKKLHPQPLIRLNVGYSESIGHAVLRGKLEAGVIGFELAEPGLQFVPLVEDELVMALPPDHPWCNRSVVSVDDIKKQPYIMRERGSGTRRLVDQALVEGGYNPREFRVTAMFSDTEAVKRGIKAGLGISIVSLWAIDDDVVQGTLGMVRIEGIHLRRSFYLVTHKGRSASSLLDSFIDFLTQRLNPPKVASEQQDAAH
ncbi:MAG: selenium metabolism-associated LysR family transcriptional regulator [Candidatus Alcyoniella australis]|nr:selenium metabolism-associated LysR family transcriptional regulator [Candidatus Alcyoniella australis]